MIHITSLSLRKKQDMCCASPVQLLICTYESIGSVPRVYQGEKKLKIISCASYLIEAQKALTNLALKTA